MAIYRQGDVLLRRVSDELAPGIRTRPCITERMTPGIILATGEKTGHAHVVDPTEANEIIDMGCRYIDVRESATVHHEEHDPITLPEGVYLVQLQREYMPKSSAESTEPLPAPRRVID